MADALCDMGFSMAHVQKAISACGGDVDEALEWLLMNPEEEEEAQDDGDAAAQDEWGDFEEAPEVRVWVLGNCSCL